jgi:rod shape-determining protein MreD
LIRYLSIPLLVLAAILQSTLIPEFRIDGAGFDLVLVIVIAWVLTAGAADGVIWAVIAGVCQDLLNGTPTGTSAMALVFACAAVNLLFGQLGQGRWFFAVIAAGAATVVYHAALLLLYLLFGRSVSVVYTVTHITLWSIPFNMGLMLFVYPLVRSLYGQRATKKRGMLRVDDTGK